MSVSSTVNTLLLENLMPAEGNNVEHIALYEQTMTHGRTLRLVLSIEKHLPAEVNGATTYTYHFGQLFQSQFKTWCKAHVDASAIDYAVWVGWYGERALRLSVKRTQQGELSWYLSEFYGQLKTTKVCSNQHPHDP